MSTSREQLRERVAAIRFRSFTDGGMRGFMDHHIDAIVDALLAEGSQEPVAWQWRWKDRGRGERWHEAHTEAWRDQHMSDQRMEFRSLYASPPVQEEKLRAATEPGSTRPK